MARETGMFHAAANYEVLKAAPFDARMKVESKADLTNPDTWTLRSGERWIYDGMIVAVAHDADPANNGIYILLDAANFTNEAVWQKDATESDIAALKEQIEEIEVSNSADIEVGNFDQLPAIGMSGITYYVQNEKAIYRWNADTTQYIKYGGGTADLDDIKIIYGGDSNG